MLNDGDIEALDDFRENILDAVQTNAYILVNKLTQTYPNMDVDYLVELVDEVLNEFTEEVMNPLIDLNDDLDI